MSIHDKLLAVQAALKAPKGQLNKFGGYHYRSCEDILEAVKPLLSEHKLVLVISDSIESIGNRVYVKATATISDGKDAIISANAYAREEQEKKGMSESQITGSASSYARKYALNGLLLIDDTKDADTQDNRPADDGKKSKANSAPPQNPKTPTQPTITFVMESFNKAKDMANLEAIYRRANEYTWTEQDKKDIAECYANVAKRLQPSSNS